MPVLAPLSKEQVGMKYGFRSGLEERIAAELMARKVPFKFEQEIIHFEEPAKKRRYTPDFLLPNGIFIETKGRFQTADRQKHKMIRVQHPDLDIRFLFSNTKQKISKTSTTTYAMWCSRFHFQFAKAVDISSWSSWLAEPLTAERKAALANIGITI